MRKEEKISDVFLPKKSKANLIILFEKEKHSKSGGEQKNEEERGEIVRGVKGENRDTWPTDK